MCLKDLRGVLRNTNGKPCLILDKETTVEHIEEIMDLYDGNIRITHKSPHELYMESPNIKLQTIALDLQEEGANIKIAHNVSLDGFLQTPDHLYRGAPANWELGNHLPIATA